MANLTLTNVKKSYGDVDVIHGVDLEIEDGEFVVFVGPSGCGKSTLLRMIAGLEEISEGSISINGALMNDVTPSKRGVAMVFQTYALYPHMTVRGNMEFGLKQSKTPKAEIDRRVNAAADILQITDFLDRVPKNLSGGQRQRVAIGRAIVRDPEVFLFDEPLSNLDAALRVQTRIEIAKLHQRLGATMIYVTHDQVEALTLADKIVVLSAGRIEQVGSPMELYNRPQNTFVAAFIGSPKMNLFNASGTDGKITYPTGLVQEFPNIPDADLVVGLRPEHVMLCDKSVAMISGTLDLVEKLGEYALVYLTAPDGTSFTAKLPEPPVEGMGTELFFNLPTERLHVFNRDTGQRLVD